jgi:hypothetical protein
LVVPGKPLKREDDPAGDGFSFPGEQAGMRANVVLDGMTEA